MGKSGKRDCKLSLQSILELVWLFLNTRTTVRDAAAATGHGTATVVEWWNNCRGVCSGVLKFQPKFKGTRDSPVQVDESYFAGKRKYRRGRILAGDRRTRPLQVSLDDDMADDGAL